MNKYVFPGADASASLGWVVKHLEAAGFEVKNVDVLGVHYSATIFHWYNNWLSNREKVVATYGERWFRVWAFFLAWSTYFPGLFYNIQRWERFPWTILPCMHVSYSRNE